MSFSYKLGTKFCDVCKNLRINKHDRDIIWRVLIEEEGYTERALCFVAAKCEDKLIRFIGDSRFVSVFINEVRKNAFKPGDPRWCATGREIVSNGDEWWEELIIKVSFRVRDAG